MFLMLTAYYRDVLDCSLSACSALSWPSDVCRQATLFCLFVTHALML